MKDDIIRFIKSKEYKYLKEVGQGGTGRTILIRDDTPDELFIVSAREFGFKRTGENITTSLQSVYKPMLKNGEITEVDSKVQITAG